MSQRRQPGDVEKGTGRQTSPTAALGRSIVSMVSGGGGSSGRRSGGAANNASANGTRTGSIVGSGTGGGGGSGGLYVPSRHTEFLTSISSAGSKGDVEDSDAENTAEFWIPPLETQDDTFDIITFKEQEKGNTWTSWIDRLPRKSEIVSGWLGALLVGVLGLLLIMHSGQEDKEEEIKNCLLPAGSEKEDWEKTARKRFYTLIFGEIFFDAAVVASYELAYKIFEAVFMVVWNRVANATQERKCSYCSFHPRDLKFFHLKDVRSFHLKDLRQFIPLYSKDLLRVIPVAIFFCVGTPLLGREEAKSQLNWGKILFATGLIYVAIRAMFFVPQPDDEIRKLKEKVEELETSVALGLADGYFFNFLSYVRKDIKSEYERGADNKTRITYKKGPTKDLNVKCFIVAVPRNIDWSPTLPITEMIKCHKGVCAFDCHVGPANEESDFRPQMVYMDHESTETPDISVLFDVPTTLQVITRNIRDTSKLETSEAMDEQYRLEVNRFTYRLAWRAYQMGMGKHVRIVELNNTIQETQDENSSDENPSLVGIIRLAANVV